MKKVVKHIVMWRLRNEAMGRDKWENAQLLVEKLEALQGVIPDLLKIEVGINFNTSPDSYDVVLVSEMENQEALKAYQGHPAHQAVIPFVKAVTMERKVVDFEVESVALPLGLSSNPGGQG